MCHRRNNVMEIAFPELKFLLPKTTTSVWFCSLSKAAPTPTSTFVWQRLCMKVSPLSGFSPFNAFWSFCLRSATQSTLFVEETFDESLPPIRCEYLPVNKHQTLKEKYVTNLTCPVIQGRCDEICAFNWFLAPALYWLIT